MDEKFDVKTPEYVSLQFELAGLGSRSIAFMIDQTILTVVNIVIFLIPFLIFMSDFNFITQTDVSFFLIAIVLIILFVINFGYFIVAESFFGGKTIGKNIAGIRVIQENGHGITFLSSFIRNFLRLIDSLPASYLLGIIMIYAHPKHKRLGDLVAGTIVVHERKAKKTKKQTPLEREIANRGLDENNLQLSDWDVQTITNKDWTLIDTYCSRLLTLKSEERTNLTKKVAEIIFPKLSLSTGNKTTEELENDLLVIHMRLKKEWEFEL